MSQLPNDLTDDDNVIQGDAWCGRCGYNVRGVSANGVCPECGTTIVKDELRKSPLRRSIPTIILKVLGISFAACLVGVAVLIGLVFWACGG
jgi:hypothetical protein